VGTAAYMSPEQAQGRRVDARSDIFSFGSVLYEMVTGRRAFSRESTLSTLVAILKEEPRPPSELVPAVPRELERLIQHCMRKDPARRFQHMDDVRTLLEQLREDSASGELSVVAPSPRSPFFWLTAAGLASAVLVVAVETWSWRRPTAPAPEAPSVATPFTTSPGFEVQPTFSPDGNEIAFAWNGEKEDNYDIYRKLIGPGEALRLTRDPAWDYSPAWSPDGRLIAFLRQPDQGPPGIYVIPALGGAERRWADIAAIPGWNTGIAWTADNKRLIVSDQPAGELPGLFLLSLESSEQRRLTSVPQRMPGVPSAVRSGDWDPALSADGRTLAFTRVVDNGKGDVHLLRLGPDMTAQGSPERLTFEDRYAASPTWLSGASEMLFSQGAPEGERQILRLAAVPAGPAAIAGRQVSVGTDATNLAFSRASGRLVFSRSQGDSNIYRLGLRGPGEPQGEPERLIASTRLENNPEYSPKGDCVAFMSSRSGSTEIWLSNADGSNSRQLTSMEGPLTANPRWSPDATTILFDSRLKGSADLYVVSVQGGSPRPLTDQPSLENEASWSRDGRWIYFGSDRTGRREVWRMPASGGEATQVTRDGGSCPFESPDGRWLYYAKRRRFDLWKAPVAGGAETRVLENLSYCFNYVPTSHGVYFRQSRAGQHRACGNSGGVPRFRNGQDQAPASRAGLAVRADRVARWPVAALLQAGRLRRRPDAGRELSLRTSIRTVCARNSAGCTKSQENALATTLLARTGATCGTWRSARGLQARVHGARPAAPDRACQRRPRPQRRLPSASGSRSGPGRVSLSLRPNQGGNIGCFIFVRAFWPACVCRP